MRFSIDGEEPEVHPTVFIAPTAVVIGQVELAANSSIWFGAVIRGDGGRVSIGQGTNIQDNAVVHEEVTIGRNCVVGHQALVHACTLGDGVLVGNGAIILDGARVSDGAVIGAGAVVTPGTQVPPNTLMLGVPARSVGEASEDLRQQTLSNARHYAENRGRYLAGLKALE